jgi:hypothetical protein
MSLPQLIGLQCAACQKSISSIIDGAFCEDCGNPVHRKCIASVQQAPEERCPLCGGDPDGAVAQEVQRERDAQGQTATPTAGPTLSEPATIAFPVSATCPKCASAQFTRVPPTSLVAFAKDRVCTQCGTQYTPPTPLWGSLLFLALGGIFLLISIGGFVLVVATDSIRPRTISGVIGGSILGGALLAFGIGSLGKSDKIVSTTTNDGDGQ